MFESDNLEDVSFNINKDYAKRFEHNKKREELHRLEEKYGKNVKDLAGESSDSGSEEDDDAIYDSISKDKGFLRVLSKLKSKDPAIYDKEKNWFEDVADNTVKEKKDKPMFLKDYERETLLGKGTLVIDSDEDDSDKAITYTEEQRSLKEDFKSALNSATGDEEPVLTLRSKTSDEMEKEDEDYRKWLKGEKGKLKDKALKSDCEFLKTEWSDPKLDENEKFLRDFILNKGWVDENDKDFVPTYDEIINDDDDEVDEHETFERQFNFRFEEPDHDLIKNYPRTIANSVRKNDESRKEKRKKKQERKLKEKEEKKQEIERLKKLKFEEIEGKLQKLSDNAGKDISTALQDCLEDDFNPKEHDKVMSKLFDEEYYDEHDNVKPVFSDSDEDLLDDEAWYNKIADSGESSTVVKTISEPGHTNGDRKGPEEEPNVIYREAAPEEDEERFRKRSWKRKRSKKFKEAVVKEKPNFNPDEGPFEKYFDDYYKLDCEDVIGDVKCRFGYRKTKPSSYGLTIDEIIMADDKELNQWYSFKKMMKYRSNDQENKDQKKFQNDRRNEFMKRQILKSLYPDEAPSEPAQDQPEPPKKKEKKSKLVKEEVTTETASSTDQPSSKKKKSITPSEDAKPSQTSASTSPKKKKGKPEKKSKDKNTLTQSRLAAYGFS